MITFSGRRLEPPTLFEGRFAGSPGVSNIALASGRIPRFGGMTRTWWTLMHHSLVCQQIAHELSYDPRLQWLCLMHDAHEVVTSDVPAFWKPKELSEWQAQIDEHIWAFFGVSAPTAIELLLIKEVDERALRAEAQVLGPPMICSHLAPGYADDVLIVQGVQCEFPSPLDTDGIDSKSAKVFYRVFSYLIRGAVQDSARDDHPGNVKK